MSLVIKRMKEMIKAEKLRGEIGFGFRRRAEGEKSRRDKRRHQDIGEKEKEILSAVDAFVLKGQSSLTESVHADSSPNVHLTTRRVPNRDVMDIYTPNTAAALQAVR